MSEYNFREHLSDEFVISEHDVSRLLLRAPYAYKRYTIPKKNGGVRHIAQPAKETKIIQHFMMSEWFSKLPVHECAAAYKSGASIKDNAQRHSDCAYISKFDFVNFFGSITEVDIRNLLVEVFGSQLSEKSIADMARMSCIRDRVTGRLVLSIGAPSSPVLSNAVMFNFDSVVNQWCREHDIVYSRYADDLTFSSNRKGVTFLVEDFLQGTLKELPEPSLSLNTEKTVHASKKNQRRVTGLVLSNDGNVTIGRDRKRLISAMVHRYALGELDNRSIANLQGLLGFALDVEPLFVAKLRGKYTSKVITELMRVRAKKDD
ncbi:retron St85 family RNA-directed DNA polymerase [Pseudomonas promysalinigenes]|uniref:retron St85 family RNA-directed DNA polymerase n=1 Tax=Pseudomonas promysalinigenes TaxID=485898 RepID=UPI00164976BE|nr:retron St85 family RNA-directed DNA polymerase [Pseudomonas promysalinigenes]QXI34385.1 retron St85 family RNA-directed DNA polymerase [Pseudomonas promysalinigenes]